MSAGGTGRPLLIALLVALVLTGCVAVPTKGQIERIEGQQPACQNCVNVDVAPPTPGAEPLEIVQGYLRANSNYQPNFSVAKQFLTKAAAQSWSPEDGASIYTGTLTGSDDNVVLDATLIGTLGADRTYTARDRKVGIDFGLVKENGEWRIGKPPPGLMVEQYSFASFYQPYNLYFIGNDGVLVPDPIYLPSLRSQSSTTSVLMKGLLNGPSAWLKPAVTSAIPVGTALSVDAVTVDDGVAAVALSDQVLSLNDAQRSLMAAQVVYTLKQVPGVQSVVFMVNQQPMRIPGTDTADFSIDVDSLGSDVDPIPFIAGQQLYVARADGVRQFDATATDVKSGKPLSGDLGNGRLVVDQLAASVSNTDLALVTDGGTVLRSSSTAGADLTTLLGSGASHLLRPQFSRFGELWALGRAGSGQRFWVFSGDKQLAVQTPLLDGTNTIAFRISPDGSRIALVRRVKGHSELGLGRISRAADKIVVNGWRDIDTTQSNLPEIAGITDVAWVDDTTLLVLGTTSGSAVPALFRVSQDASKISLDTEPTTWDAHALSVLLSDQTTVVVGATGRSWKGSGGQWEPFVDGVRAASYPG
ncbi:LpqB family beta-propeller domain-containing protein [Microlunatus ginsengisoli]|uniref:LpqB family beta-propeller domain-containing protein n=1 Tax=Microlunatus ginsengisoli TaxID=363863 RepID=A0ABP6ZB83_9ACTN